MRRITWYLFSLPCANNFWADKLSVDLSITLSVKQCPALAFDSFESVVVHVDNVLFKLPFCVVWTLCQSGVEQWTPFSEHMSNSSIVHACFVTIFISKQNLYE